MLLFINIYNLQVSSLTWSQVHGNILKSHGFYRFLRQRNVAKFIFLSFNNFSPTPLTCRALLRLKNCHKLLRFFLFSQQYWFRVINALDPTNFWIQSTTEGICGNMWFTHFDALCNYLHSFRKQSAASFFKNSNCCFPDRENAGH